MPQNDPTLLVRPIMQHGSHEIGAGSLDRLRRKEVVLLQLNPRAVARLFSDAQRLGRIDDVGDLLQDQSPGVLGNGGLEVLQDLCSAASDIHQGRCVAVRAASEALYQVVLHGIHVDPPWTVYAKSVYISVKAWKLSGRSVSHSKAEPHLFAY